MLLLAVLLVILYFVAKHYIEKIELDNLKNKPVFITGCDTGFGHALVLKCLSRGMPVFAGCLTENGAENLKKESRNLPGKLETIIVNVASDESVEKAKKILEEKTKPFGGLHGVVNNAGISGYSFADDLLTVEDYKKAAEVNIWGIVRITHAVKDLIKQVKGRIVITTSICGRVAMPFLGPYTVSKFAGEGYGDTIRKELHQWGVKVSIVEPGAFKTPILDKTNVNTMLDSVWKRASSEKQKIYGIEFLEKCQKIIGMMSVLGSERIDFVVDAYFHALTARFPRPRYWAGYDAIFGYIPLSMLPTTVQDFIFYAAMLLLGRPRPAALK